MERLDLFATCAGLRAKGVGFCLVTVVRAKGSTPRHPGAKMVVTADRTVGTIGGGRLEHQVIEAARAALLSGDSQLVRWHLTRELAMCCGGEMELFVDVNAPRQQVILVGAGHVNAALAALLGPLDFDLAVIDEDEAWRTSARFPGARLLGDWEPGLWGVSSWANTLIVVATRDHAVDQRVLEALHGLGAVPRWLGCLGSRGKLGRFYKRLAAKGADAAWIEQVRGPIGADIGAETPEELAISIAAELVHVRRRGRPLPESRWQEPVDDGPRAETGRGGTDPHGHGHGHGPDGP